MLLRAPGTPALAATLLALLVLLPAAAQAVAPSVTGVSITSRPILKTETPEAYHPYGPGDHIDVALTFSRAVTVTGAPRLALSVGSRTRQADFRSASGSAVNFRYRIRGGDRDGDGVSIAADALTLNGGGIRAGSVDAALGLGSHAITNAANHRVDGGGASFDGVASPSYRFTRGVRGSFILPAAGSTQADGAYVLAPAPALPGGLVFDSATRTLSGAPAVGMAQTTYTLNVTHLVSGSGGIVRAVSDSLPFSIAVAGTQPAVSGVSIASRPASGASYATGENIDVDVTFNYPVTVTGAPRLALRIGAGTRQAAYRSHSGSTVQFRYAVTAADFDGDGIGIAAGALTLDGGGIRASNVDVALDLGSHAIANASGHAVNDSAPSFGATTVESKLYDTGTTITPIVLPEATGGDGTLSYTLAPAKLPLGLIWTASTRTIAGTPTTVTAAATYTWKATDADGDSAALTFTLRVWAPAGPAIEGTSVRLETVNGRTRYNYWPGEAIWFLVQYPEKVAVTGTPQVTLVVGDRKRKADYSAADTAWLRRATNDDAHDLLVFTYTVRADDFDGDGIAVPADALSLNGGTIRAADGGADAKLSLGTHAVASGDATSARMRVRDTAPSFSQAASAANRSLAKDVETATTLPLATGDGALTYAISPALPRGLSMASASPKITGTPTVAGATTHTLTATDADGDGTTLGPFTVTVVDGAPVVSGVTIVSKPYANATYGLGEVVQATVSFDRNLTWTNISRSRLSLDVGGSTREARYKRFLGNGLLYEYTVQAADRDADGIGIGADALALNGAPLSDSATGAAAVTVLGTHAIANAAAHKVDGSVATPLAVKSVSIESSPARSDGYDAGEVIKARVAFSRPVRINGSPRLALTIGADTRQAAAGPYLGLATQLYWDSILFSYTVTARDRDSNGIGIGASALALNGATIRDAAGATPSLGLGTRAIADDSAHKVHTPPRITGVSIISSPGANGTYDAGETITVEFSWSEQVIFGGNGMGPQVALTIGADTRRVHRDQAAVIRGHWYRYSYTVTASDRDLDGISVAANALTLPAGVRLYALSDNDRADLSLGTHAITNDSGHTVRDSKPSFSAAAARRYLLNAAVSDPLPAATGGDGTVAYALTGPGAATSLSLPDGLSWDTATRTISGTPTAATAAASYTLSATDGDRDRATYVFDLSVVSDPVVSGVRITSRPASGDAYRAGETITAEVAFDQTLTVTGTPRLAIAVGATTRQASGSHRAGESRISFRYTVATEDRDTDGIAVAADALTLDGATIRNAGGEDARLGLGAHAVAAQTGHKVSAPPRVTGVRLLTTNMRCCWGVRPAGWEDPRQTNENLYPPSLLVTMVTFDQPVAVSGAPTFAITIGANTRRAAWNEFLSRLVHPTANPHGAGDLDVMAFHYELQASDFDGDGVGAAASALALNGATIRDAEGENAVLGLGSHAIANQASLRVADTAPTFGAAEARRYLLNLRASDRLPAATGDGAMTYALTGPGTATTLSLPRGLSWNAATRTISGTPTSATAAASYTLTATDADGDTGTLTFDLSVVTDPAVGGVRITSRPASGDAYRAGETITVEVTFDQAVTVTGAPQLALTIGSATRQATGSPVAGQRALSFRYPVTTSDRDTDGISITGGALTLAGGTIRNAKGENARLGLGGHAVAGAAGHKVSTPPRVERVKLYTTELKCCWTTHDAGWADPRQTAHNRFAPAVVLAAVTFDQALVRGGAGWPSLALTIGGTTRQATFDGYLSGQLGRTLGKSNGQMLGFFYTLQPSDFDGDGIGVAAGALTLPAGTTLRDAQGEAAVLGLGTHAIANDPNHRVADTAPSFGTATVQPQHWVAGSASSLTLPAATGDGAVSHALTPAQRPSWLAFDPATRVLSGTPPAAAARTGYTWTATDADGDSTALAFPLTVAAANAPKVSEVKLLSSPAAHSMYAPGSAIEVGVKFDKAVSVTGTPTLALDVGGATRQARYTALRNGYLVFSWTVQQADYDTDGVSIGTGALAAPAGGGIFDAADAALRAALGLGSHAIADAGGHKVGSPPRVTGVSIHSTPPQAGTYTKGTTVTVQVDFDQTVTVTGTPQLALTIGSATRQASAVAESGTGRSRVRFSWTVAAADADRDGLGVAAAALALNGGAIRDLDGQDAVPGLGSHARTAFANARVDGSRTGLWPDFGQAASPTLTLTAGRAATHALPTAAGGDTPLRYAVSPGLPAGLSVNAATAVLSGASRTESPQSDYTLTATDANGDAATLAFTLEVSGSRPLASGVSIASTPLAGDTYGASEEILVDVAFERTGTGAMTVRGAPRLALAVGTAPRQASFLSVSGGTLRFRYTVQAEDRDADGIAVAADALALNGGLIRDAAGNNAVLGLGRHALAAAPAHRWTAAPAAPPRWPGSG